MFRGPDPYGTPGGQDSLSIATDPPDIRTAIGRSFAAFLRVNGELSIRDASALEIITRTITNPTGGQMTYFDSFNISGANLPANGSRVVIGSKSVTLPTGNFDIFAFAWYTAYSNGNFDNVDMMVDIGGNSSGPIRTQHDGGVDAPSLQFHYRNTQTGNVLVEVAVNVAGGDGNLVITSGRCLIVAIPSV